MVLKDGILAIVFGEKLKRLISYLLPFRPGYVPIPQCTVCIAHVLVQLLKGFLSHVDCISASSSFFISVFELHAICIGFVDHIP